MRLPEWLKIGGMLLALALAAPGCGRASGEKAGREIHIATATQVKTLDPALAGDLASRNMAGALFDTLLQYNYTRRPYVLEPSMLARMPEMREGGASYYFELRDDLFFVSDPAFGPKGGSKEARKVRSSDVVFSFLRIADARMHSPVFWLWRGRVKGIDEFYAATAAAPAESDYFAEYDRGVAGFEVIDERHFAIHLTRPDPRFLYNLAIPYTGIVPQRAVRHYGNDRFAEHPVGSGPFYLSAYRRDYEAVLTRNAEFRTETFPEAQNPADRARKLPLADRIVCSNIRQSLSAWLLFLQGELEVSVLNKDNADLIAGGRELAPALRRRRIELVTHVEFEIQYVGFSFTDPKLAGNLKLRQALTYAYNIPRRIALFNDLAVPAAGPIPPGVPGYAPELEKATNCYDLERARLLLREAGYPDGIDPATGKPLVLNFDQAGNTSLHRQLGEMAAADWSRLGLEIKVNLNNGPRFYQKLRQGEMQLFRLSWVGDYPDAENFLQLFYSKNAGGCNRVFYHDAEFDRQFEAILPMADSPERTARYQAMARYLVGQMPWIFESQPVSYQLKHVWMENFIPHDFACNRWKYWSIDPDLKAATIRSFRPLSLSELQTAE